MAASAVAGHLEQVRAHGVEPIVARHALVVVQRLQAASIPPAGR